MEENMMECGRMDNLQVLGQKYIQMEEKRMDTGRKISSLKEVRL